MSYPKPFKIRNFYTPKDVSVHNSHNDIWISLFNKVYDLTKLVHDNKHSTECDPIVLAAGTDITHWFDQKTMAVSLFFNLFLSKKLLKSSFSKETQN